jgi:hypothetical protein
MMASCGHPWPCEPKKDGRCDHVDGHGTHRGYTDRCLLVVHGDSPHFHDLRPDAVGWFQRSWGYAPILAK